MLIQCPRLQYHAVPGSHLECHTFAVSHVSVHYHYRLKGGKASICTGAVEVATMPKHNRGRDGSSDDDVQIIEKTFKPPVPVLNQ